VWHVARMGEMRNGYKILVGERERKKPLGRPRRGRGNRREGVDGIHLAQDRGQ